MKVIKTFIKNHTLFSIYTMVFLILLYGVIETTGSKYVFNMFLFFIPLITFYFGLTYLAKNKKIKGFSSLKKIPDLLPDYSFLILTGICIFLIIGHLIHIGGSPGIKGFSIMDTTNIVDLRRNITSEASSLWNYLSSFNIKAILPFSLLLLAFKKKKFLFSILITIGIFYAFSLMQKSYILTVLFPIILLTLFKKKYFQSIGLFLICGIVVISLIYIQNPQMRGGVDNVTKVETTIVKSVSDTKSYPIRVLLGLKHRIFVVPGEMVSQWFHHIPKNKPFLYGDGYGFICKMKGIKHVEYSKVLYPIIRPKYAEKGLQGSVNTASFMYEYSNFGNAGLVLSALFLGFLLFFIESIFGNNVLLKTSLNLFPIFMLSSGALTTALFSGGWGLVIVLYYIFAREFRVESERN
jgi:hypothetical protein